MEDKDNKADIDNLIRLTTLTSEVFEVPATLTNFKDNSFIYVSKRYSEMTGFRLDNNQKHTFQDVIHPKDWILINEINKNVKDVLIKVFKGKKTRILLVTYNTRIIQSNGKYESMSLIGKPIRFDKDGYPTINVTSFIYQEKRGYERFVLHTEADNKKEILYYSNTRKKYVSKELLELKHIEIELLKLTSKGFTEIQISKTLNIKLDLLRYYKKGIFKKYHVSNMSEAIYIALFYELL